MNKTKLTWLLGVLVILGLCFFMARLQRENAVLRQQLVASRDKVAGPTAEAIPVAAGANSVTSEINRLRREHLELLSLRGRYRQLAEQSREQQQHGPTNAATPGSKFDSAAAEPEADSILFSASLTNSVKWGHTMVIGGWSADGVRTYLLVTANIETAAAAGKGLSIQSQVVRAPENFWEEIGWGNYKSDTRRSTLAGVLTPDEVNSLLSLMRDTKGTDLSNTSLAHRADGEYLGLGFSIADDRAEGLLMNIDVYPRISADEQSVELGLRPAPVAPEAAVYGRGDPSRKP